MSILFSYDHASVFSFLLFASSLSSFHSICPLFCEVDISLPCQWISFTFLFPFSFPFHFLSFAFLLLFPLPLFPFLSSALFPPSYSPPPPDASPPLFSTAGGGRRNSRRVVIGVEKRGAIVIPSLKSSVAVFHVTNALQSRVLASLPGL